MNKLLPKTYLKNIAIILTIAIFFIIDRYFKIAALNYSLDGPKKIIGDFFFFNFTPNYYMAFSLPVGGWILNAAILISIGILTYYLINLKIKTKNNRSKIYLIFFILAGAFSNIIDRLVCGYVVDYLELKYFTVFNIADIMISIGALLLIILNLNKKYD